MTRRLAAAALMAGSLGFLAVPAVASHHDGRVCIGGDSHGSGRMVGYCVEDPRSVLEVGTIPLPPPPPHGR